MGENIRVPMPAKMRPISHDDLVPHIESLGPRYARRFSLDIAEDALGAIASEAVPYAVLEMAKQIGHDRRGDIERAVQNLIRDAAWLRPIVVEEFRRAARQHAEAYFEILDGTPPAHQTREGEK